MAKELLTKVKLQCPGGQATPAPPVGPALGQHGVNIAAFVKQFNDKTRDRMGLILPVVISIFKDKSMELEIKSPPASVLIRNAIKLEKGSKTPGREKVGKIGRKALEEIAKAKEKDLNAGSLDAACRMIAGTARSMGVTVEG
ncbi:MAG: 50S ribosomal protein L11 [Planctomycetes bacterium]|nr:50S ribosomal protein L11 [Planctomycetota bacterium]